jgi:hypothetical protein
MNSYEKCPKCGGDYKPVVYGYPTDETMKRAMNDEFKLGGCMVGGPSRYCTNCLEYSDDGIKELSWDDELKRDAPIRYYLKKFYVNLKIIILLPPLFLYYEINRFLKKLHRKN